MYNNKIYCNFLALMAVAKVTIFTSAKRSSRWQQCDSKQKREEVKLTVLEELAKPNMLTC